PGMARVLKAVVKFMEQARFSDSCFAHNMDHLAFSSRRVFPTARQHSQLIFAPYKRCEPTGCSRFKPAAYTGGLNHPVKLERGFDALKLLRPQALDRESPSQQPISRRGNQHAIGSCCVLHPGSNIRSIAEYVDVPAPPPTHDDGP